MSATAGRTDRPCRIVDKTDTRLELADTQTDKKLVVGVFAAIVVIATGDALLGGDWRALPMGLAALGALAVHLKSSRMRLILVIDRVDLTGEDRKGTRTWDWPLTEVRTARLSERRSRGTARDRARPDLVLTDGTVVPLRPYPSAGTQSWHAVAAIRLFLGQRPEGAPIGWIPPGQFDTLFAGEMAQPCDHTRLSAPRR